MSDLKIEQDGRLLRVTLQREGNGVSDGMAAQLSRALLAAHETSCGWSMSRADWSEPTQSSNLMCAADLL